MATLDTAATHILPRPATPRRAPARRSAAIPRGAVMRRRSARQEAPRFSGEQIDTMVLQGLIGLAMVGMVAWFHAPLAQAIGSLF
jgi:hypothetical protein